MIAKEPEYKEVHYKDGWMEVREMNNPEGWIAIEKPVKVKP